MSKTLEFVEQATIANQRRLEQHKRDLEYYKEDVSLINYGAKIFQLEHDIEHIQEIVLPNLKQIKCELEAWEVVKTKIKPVLKLDKEDYQPAYYWWITNEIINLDVLDYRKLKKALEVENE